MFGISVMMAFGEFQGFSKNHISEYITWSTVSVCGSALGGAFIVRQASPSQRRVGGNHARVLLGTRTKGRSKVTPTLKRRPKKGRSWVCMRHGTHGKLYHTEKANQSWKTKGNCDKIIGPDLVCLSYFRSSCHQQPCPFSSEDNSQKRLRPKRGRVGGTTWFLAYGPCCVPTKVWMTGGRWI